MSGRTLRWLCLAGLAIALPGCSDTDPYARNGMWQPTGANSRNLAAMVANPRDLIRGRGDRGTDGVLAAGAAARLWAGRPAPLPASGSQQAAGGPAAAPGAN